MIAPHYHPCNADGTLLRFSLAFCQRCHVTPSLPLRAVALPYLLHRFFLAAVACQTGFQTNLPFFLQCGVLENLLLKDHVHTFCNTGGDVRPLDFRLEIAGNKIGAPFHGINAFLTTPQVRQPRFTVPLPLVLLLSFLLSPFPLPYSTPISSSTRIPSSTPISSPLPSPLHSHPLFPSPLPLPSPLLLSLLLLLLLLQLEPIDKVANSVALATSPVVRALFDPEGGMRDVRALDDISFSEWFLKQGGTRESIR